MKTKPKQTTNKQKTQTFQIFSLYLKSFPSICLERLDNVFTDKIFQQDQSVHLYTDFIRDLTHHGGIASTPDSY